MLSWNARAASFHYNGKLIALTPADMTQTNADTYEYTLPDGLTAILQIGPVEDAGRTQLLRFENRGVENSGQISNVRSFDAALPAAEPVLWQSLKGDSCGAESYNPLQIRLDAGDSHSVEPHFGRPADETGFPFFDLSCGAWAATFGIGWTGQWRLTLSKSERDVRVEIGLATADFYLRPGESVRAPLVLCVSDDDVASARRTFRRLLFQRFSPKTAAGEPVVLPIAIQPFDRYNGKHPIWASVQGQKLCADAALRCGMDTLWIDAAWFTGSFPNGVGNYSFAPGFPDGLKPVSDYAHQNGLRFVQWFEPGRVNCYSETYRNHRDMTLALSSHDSVNCLFNWGDENARAWLTDTLKNHIRANGVDVYREDFNICPSGYWDSADEENRRGMTEIRFVEGQYAIWDALKEAFPDLLIDNCASGGRRIDLETCRRAVPLWRSDTGCTAVSAEKRVHTWNQNHILALTEYLPYHACATWEPEPYYVRSAQSGGLACAFDVLNPNFDFDAAERVVAEVKRLRKYWYGDFYPLTTPDNSEEIWAAWQLTLGDSGVVYAFRRDACPDESHTFALANIAPEKQYRVTVTDESMAQQTRVMTGGELAALTVHCAQPKNSAIIEYQPAESTKA